MERQIKFLSSVHGAVCDVAWRARLDAEIAMPSTQDRTEVWWQYGGRVFEGWLASYGSLPVWAGADDAFQRWGVRHVLHLRDDMVSLADCGAFSWREHEEPQASPMEVAEWAHEWRFDWAISLDHVVPDYDATFDRHGLRSAPAEWQRRVDLSIRLGGEYLDACVTLGAQFTPFGACQGWSPQSFAKSAKAMRHMGYTHLAVGGVTGLPESDMLTVISAIRDAADCEALHVLGGTRLRVLPEMQRRGATSFDSTNPGRQAFMSPDGAYFGVAPESRWTCVSLPRAERNKAVRDNNRMGLTTNSDVNALSSAALHAVLDWGERKPGVKLDDVMAKIAACHDTHSASKGYLAAVYGTLMARPWEACVCRACKTHGAYVAVFRSAKSAQLRMYHNNHQFQLWMDDQFATWSDEPERRLF